MRVHLVQFDVAWEDREANLTLVQELLDGVSVAPGDLVALPEMFDSGFSLNVERTADSDGRTASFLAELSRSKSIAVYAGRTVRRADGMGLNRASVHDATGELLCEYDKLHPFSFGREPERFAAGDRVVVASWSSADARFRICPAVCYDLRFPELFRHGLAQGAEMFLVGANWPAERAAHWRALLVARAIENQAIVVGVNRVGADPHLQYAGGSMVVAPTGEALIEAGAAEGVFSASIDPQCVHAWREKFPAWRDVRPELLGLAGHGGDRPASSPGV